MVLFFAQTKIDIPEPKSPVLDWIAPGTSTAAVIFVTLAFLKHQRFLQNNHNKALSSIEVKLSEIATNFQNQLDRIVTQMEKNEERRTKYIQQLFEKMMTVSTQTVQAITKLEQGFASLTSRVEELYKQRNQ